MSWFDYHVHKLVPYYFCHYSNVIFLVHLQLLGMRFSIGEKQSRFAGSIPISTNQSSIVAAQYVCMMYAGSHEVLHASSGCQQWNPVKQS